MKVDSLSHLAKKMGIYWREPKNTFERILSLFFCNSQWARRTLGGRWELVVHDKGGLNFVLIWFWVDRWSEGPRIYWDNLVGKEFYLKGLKQHNDFGDSYYKRQDELSAQR